MSTFAIDKLPDVTPFTLGQLFDACLDIRLPYLIRCFGTPEDVVYGAKSIVLHKMPLSPYSSFPGKPHIACKEVYHFLNNRGDLPKGQVLHRMVPAISMAR